MQVKTNLVLSLYPFNSWITRYAILYNSTLSMILVMRNMSSLILLSHCCFFFTSFYTHPILGPDPLPTKIIFYCLSETQVTSTQPCGTLNSSLWPQGSTNDPNHLVHRQYFTGFQNSLTMLKIILFPIKNIFAKLYRLLL